MQAERPASWANSARPGENKDVHLLQLAHTLPEFDNCSGDENLAYLNPMLKRQLRELEVSYYGGQDGLMGACCTNSSNHPTDISAPDLGINLPIALTKPPK